MEQESNNSHIPAVTEDDILKCQFSSWYSSFEKQSVPSIIVQLSEEFIQYLHQDGVFLPEGSEQESIYKKEHLPGDSDDDWSDEDDDGFRPPVPKFEALQSEIRQSIDQLGGAVFPKLNWSSPKDAKWISPNGIKCHNPGDVFVLLKSSDFIVHDLCHAFDACQSDLKRPDSFYLVLRKWRKINPSLEFRCFVKDKELIAISQRDHTSYYDFLVLAKEDLQDKIEDFFDHTVSSNFDLRNYAFDVYLTSKGRVILLDFNPFYEDTEPLLFSWDELANAPSSGHVEFRVVDSPQAVRSTLDMVNSYPKDVMDFASGQLGIDDSASLIDMLQQATDSQKQQGGCAKPK